MSSSLLFNFKADKSTNTVFIDKTFDAELSLVWDAFTKPEILDQWWAPKPLISKTKYMDFRVGGRRFYAMVWPEGQEYWGVEKYLLINPKTHLKWLGSYTDKDENVNPGSPTAEWDLKFSEHPDNNQVTKLNISVYLESLEDLEKMIAMGFQEGFSMTINELPNVLETLKKQK